MLFMRLIAKGLVGLLVRNDRFWPEAASRNEQLGRWLYSGEGLKEDKKRGLKHLEAAAENGHQTAARYIKFCVDGSLVNTLQQQIRSSLHALESPAVSPKQGRNEPCRCGSGKKYKKCCGV